MTEHEKHGWWFRHFHAYSYQCQYCNFACDQIQDLRNHWRKYHENEFSTPDVPFMGWGYGFDYGYAVWKKQMDYQ